MHNHTNYVHVEGHTNKDNITTTTSHSTNHHVHVEACKHQWAFCDCGTYFCKLCGKEEKRYDKYPYKQPPYPGRGPFWQVIS